MQDFPLKRVALVVKWLYRAGYLLPFAGLIILFVFPLSNAFARSGCMMVAVSISLVYLNHFFIRDAESNAELAEAASKLATINPASLPEVEKRLPAEALSELQKLGVESLEELSEYVRRTGNLVGTIAKGNQRAEFSFGIAGTLIWGFGDLSWFVFTSLFVLVPLWIAQFWYGRSLLGTFEKADAEDRS